MPANDDFAAHSALDFPVVFIDAFTRRRKSPVPTVPGLKVFQMIKTGKRRSFRQTIAFENANAENPLESFSSTRPASARRRKSEFLSVRRFRRIEIVFFDVLAIAQYIVGTPIQKLTRSFSIAASVVSGSKRGSRTMRFRRKYSRSSGRFARSCEKAAEL
jgi:hypothetical protein